MKSFSAQNFTSTEPADHADFHDLRSASLRLHCGGTMLPEPHILLNYKWLRSKESHCLTFDINDIIAIVPSIIIRKIDDRTKSRLRVRAASHGRSMEEEAREILRSALISPATGGNLAEMIRRRFASIGGVNLELPRRDPMREPPRFEE